jgi:hypothetical protein
MMLSALARTGSAMATVRAVSVLRFQAIITLLPTVGGTAGGTTSTGRPLSNRAASTVASRAWFSRVLGRPTTVMSNERP